MAALVIAEKPSVGRDIARVLGCSQKGDGFLAGKDYVVSWAIGHLVAPMEPDEIRPEWKKWRRDQLPMLPDEIPLKVLPKTRAQFECLKKLISDPNTDRVICATDSGREGELIFRRIYLMARGKKPVDRLWISSMTDAAIREGFAQLKSDSAYDALYTSALCRANADWLVGMNASRAFSLRYDAHLSVGRVQTPTLMLLVQRDREIRAFVPQDYWEVKAGFGDYDGLWFDPIKNESRIPTKEKADEIKKAASGKIAVVEEVSRETKRTAPPRLFDLTTLQRECNRLFRLSAAKTLEIAQALYERGKLITYPRTDSRYLPHDMIPKIRQALGGMDGELAPLAKGILEKGMPTPPRIYDDSKVSDHHAIVPTGKKPAASLTDLERKVYDLIRRRLVSAHMGDYIYESAKAITNAGGEKFKSTGVRCVERGWREAEPESRKEADLPLLKVGDERKVESVKIARQQTKPPEKLTDASLLGLMENAGKNLEDESLRESMKDSGLGTPATRAAIIERLIEMGYARRSGKALESTPKGEKLICAVPPEISSAETTGKWERALSRMARSSEEAPLRAQKFMESIRRYSAFLVESADRAPGVVFEKEAPKSRRAPARAAVRVTPGAPTKKEKKG